MSMDSLRPDPFMTDAEVRAASQRSNDRDSLFVMARLTMDGGDPQDVRVRNLSERGLMADLERPVTVGTRVALDLRGIGTVAGRVAWHAEGRVGIALDSPINPRKARKPVGRGQTTPDYVKPFAR